MMNEEYINEIRLKDGFFNVPCIQLAKNLLGTVLARRLPDGSIIKGKIVETECYLGGEDKASHSFNGRRTPGNEPMFCKAGTMYVYFTYGMYHCFNISSQEDGGAVLLRAIEPLYGTEHMLAARNQYMDRIKSKKSTASAVKQIKSYKIHELCNGPSKLCISFNIDKETCNKQDITTFKYLWIEPRLGQLNEDDVVISTRIGIGSAGEIWANKLLRFYIFKNPNVSKVDKQREKFKLNGENNV